MILFCWPVYICKLVFYCKKELTLPPVYFMSYQNEYKLLDF